MKRFLKWTGLASVVAGLGLGIYLVAIQLTGNFAAVVPGEAYRSNQPTPAELAAYAERYKIRTVINLRGRDEKSAWYKNEAAAARQLGLTLIDFPLNASRRLDAKTADDLVATLRAAPRPILIHCRSGADRTGLASVIYLARIAQEDEETAERQLSIRYGHFGVPFFSPTYAMDESWEDMEAAARSAG
ncbi:dual specificity protein phosphatase family protein [Shinella zoogloeoides]|uniref:dual specificity protein phosphatase family protein n=1 Tax=Shinella zoogloeoides TaxID=352475 RepID=UPI0028A91A0F|nr:dual specificity protein phosphatase family protein [Shinella zoogloeoides]